MFWGIVVENGKKYAQKVESSYHLTMAALDISQKHKGQVSLYLEQNKTEFLLCNLDYDKGTHQQLDLVFDSEEDVTFFVKGEGNVHLTGYVLPDEYDGLDEDGLDEDESMDEEDEEIDEKDLKSLNKLIEDRKRKHAEKETNAKKAKLDEKAKGDEPEKKNTQANKKTLPVKKVESDEDDSEDEDDEDLDDEAIQKLLKDKKFEEDDDDEDDFDDDDDESLDEQDQQQLKKYKEEIKKQLANQTNKGILKAGQDDKKKQTPQQNKQQQKQQNQNQQSGKKQQQQQQTPKGKPQMNGKAGTPMPAKNANTPNKLKKMPGGVSFEDVVVGSGPEAKKGRHLFVNYVGRLENGEEFDRSKGKPFTFKLGAGEVIKGWEQGMDGMRVGGKRLLTIPPHLGYGDRKMGPIPSKSTLKFEVTLKAVK